MKKSVERCLSSQPNDYDERLGTQEKSVAELLQRQKSKSRNWKGKCLPKNCKSVIARRFYGLNGVPCPQRKLKRKSFMERGSCDGSSLFFIFPDPDRDSCSLPAKAVFEYAPADAGTPFPTVQGVFCPVHLSFSRPSSAQVS